MQGHIHACSTSHPFGVSWQVTGVSLAYANARYNMYSNGNVRKHNVFHKLGVKELEPFLQRVIVILDIAHMGLRQDAANDSGGNHCVGQKNRLVDQRSQEPTDFDLVAECS